MTNRIAVFGDVHLEKLNSIIPGDALELQLQNLRVALTQCRKLGINRVVQAGDLFNSSKPAPETVLRFADVLLEYKDIYFIVIAGNHDRPLLERHSLKTLHWLGQRQYLPLRIILKPTKIKLTGIPIYLCPHPYVLDAPEGTQIAIGHFAWRGARRENGSRDTSGSTPVGEWLLGDFHEAQSGQRYTYAGSLSQLHWLESKNKSFLVLQRHDDGQLTRHRVPLPPQYTLQTTVISKIEDLDNITFNPNEYHFVRIHPEVSLPPDWQRSYPNIIRREYVAPKLPSKAERNQIQLDDDPFDGLTDWLTTRNRVSPESIDWCTRLIDHIRR